MSLNPGGESGLLAREDSLGQQQNAIEAVRSSMAKRQWDLDLHKETCYMMQVSIWKGVGSKARIDFEQLGLHPQVIEELKALGASEPRIPIFESFNQLYNRLDTKRKDIQKLMKCSNRIWFLPQGKLVEVNELLEEMEAEAEDLRQEALDQYHDGLALWMQGISGLLAQAGVQPEQMALALDYYRASFPRREDVEASLSVSVTWLGEIQPISETIKSSLELQAAEAKAEAAKAEAEGRLAEADAAQHRAALLAMQLKGLHQQDKLVQSLQADTATEVEAILQEQRQMIMKVVNGCSVTPRTHAAVMGACERLQTLLGLVSQEQRVQFEGQVAQVTEQVKAALDAPRGAFESTSLDAELWAAEKALEQFAGDYSGAEAQDYLANLAKLRDRVGLLTEVLDSRAQGLATRLEQLQAKLMAGSPDADGGDLEPAAYDAEAGF